MMTSRVTPQPSLSRGTGQVTRVWMLSYECAGLAQAGGFGEAVAGIAKTLPQGSQIKVTGFLPRHWRHLEQDLRTDYNLKDGKNFIPEGDKNGKYPVLFH